MTSKTIIDKQVKGAAAALVEHLRGKEFSAEIQTAVANSGAAAWRNVYLMPGGVLGVKHSIHGKLLTTAVFGGDRLRKNGTVIATVLADLVTYQFKPWRLRNRCGSTSELYNHDEDAIVSMIAEDMDLELLLGVFEDAIVKTGHIPSRQALEDGLANKNEVRQRRTVAGELAHIVAGVREHKEEVGRIQLETARLIQSLRGEMAAGRAEVLARVNDLQTGLQRILEALDAQATRLPAAPVFVGPPFTLPGLPVEGPQCLAAVPPTEDWPARITEAASNKPEPQNG